MRTVAERMPTPPRQANSLIVGGPAYFTPEGYQAPYQPEQSFMPTNVAPDPIRDQFNRMYPTPPPPPPAPAPHQHRLQHQLQYMNQW
jgi:hypothetical protein